ncbi:MAG: general secretion pathway protein GspK [Sphingobacteriia bacterium]|nr:general secretion pathway protein GspK [Sphingobacteriia bacterium]NCC38668.1 general secretion pathway protein GspK [Gammaproteobacteria bacterium]
MRQHQHGIALVLVLWVLSLLTIMAMGLTTTQRTETALSETHVSAARFRAAADAAIAYAALVLSLPPPDTSAPEVATWLPNGVAHPWRFDGIDLTVRIFNEASRIDLNQASSETLTGLLGLLGADDDTATALASAILDWRDEDDLNQLNGAEDSDYLQAGRALGAKDAPFVVADELLQVLGMTPELYRRLAPEISVDMEGLSFDERFASPLALAAIQGISLEDATVLVAERDAPLFDDATEAGFVDRGGPLYRIQVTESSQQGGGRGMEALLEIMPGLQPPYRLRWRRLGLSGGASEVDSADAT